MLRTIGMTRADANIVEVPRPDDWYDLAFRPLETALEKGVIDAMYSQSRVLRMPSETTGTSAAIGDLARYPDWRRQAASIPAASPART